MSEIPCDISDCDAPAELYCRWGPSDEQSGRFCCVHAEEAYAMIAPLLPSRTDVWWTNEADRRSR